MTASEPNIILAKPCSFGPAGCAAEKLPCNRCKTLCWLSHSTKQDAESLNEPYIIVCYQCAVTLDLPNEIYVGDRTLADVLKSLTAQKQVN